MNKLTKEEMIKIVEKNISMMENKSFNVYFYVPDTKGVPSGSLSYIYDTALTLMNDGYNVVMIHNESEFEGVESWMGEEYGKIPHKNIEKDNVEINPCDFLIIPDLFANVMIQTKKLPCKRLILLQNFNFLSEMMPVGITPFQLGINEMITTTSAQEKKIQKYFPGIKTHIVSPSIKDFFRASTFPKKLIINFVSKDQSDINQIIKPFYWKYPLYKWVSFRDLRGLNQKDFSEALKESAITIWIDDKSNFGYSCIEALKCGSIVLAKIPDNDIDWVYNENGELNNSCLWFDNLDDVPDMIASVVRSWTLDKIPSELYEEIGKMGNAYLPSKQKEEIKYVYEDTLFKRRNDEFKEVLNDIKTGVLKVNNE